jgi:hypothetical protein
MVRVTTQETFDGVVKENMDDFDMEKKEAVEDAKKQFEAQVNRVTDWAGSGWPRKVSGVLITNEIKYLPLQNKFESLAGNALIYLVLL